VDDPLGIPSEAPRPVESPAADTFDEIGPVEDLLPGDTTPGPDELETGDDGLPE
jgi:hypothetical protein